MILIIKTNQKQKCFPAKDPLDKIEYHKCNNCPGFWFDPGGESWNLCSK